MLPKINNKLMMKCGKGFETCHNSEAGTNDISKYLQYHLKASVISVCDKVTSPERVTAACCPHPHLDRMPTFSLKLMTIKM